MIQKEKILFIRERDIKPTGTINYGMGLIATIASTMYDCKVIDNNAMHENYSPDDILECASTFAPRVICFSIITLNALRSYRTISILKKTYPEIPIVAGGLHVNHKYHEALEHGVDFAVRGEAELVILPLLDAVIKAGHLEEAKDVLNIEGVFYYRGCCLVGGGICPLPRQLDSVSFIDYALYNLKDFNILPNGRNVFPVMTQRGCPFACSFCSDAFSRVPIRYRSVENVIENIRYLVEKFNARVISFNDSDFLISEKRVVELCKAIIAKALHEKVSFLIQTDSWKVINKDVLKLMKKAGVNSISFGIERFDEISRQCIRKKLKDEVILKNIANAHALGFVVLVNYLIGFPYDSKELIDRENQSFQQLFQCGVNVISTNILNPMPGTEIYQEYADRIDGWYLNKKFDQEYIPFYVDVKNLFYDPLEINVFSCDKALIQKFVDSKVYFRCESIKQRSYVLYCMFKAVLCAAGISEFLCRHGWYKVERYVFGRIVLILNSVKRKFVYLWATAS
jgi:radical SAM superfamily enzyme YgiQ (UPF0313 family)